MSVFAALGSPYGKRADLLALLYVMISSISVTFPYDALGPLSF